MTANQNSFAFTLSNDQANLPRQYTAFGYAAVGTMGFFILSTLAMFTYGGGTERDHSHPHYSFFNNFFSDLGRTQAFSGKPNWMSLILFLSSMLSGSMGLSIFFRSFAIVTASYAKTGRRTTIHLSHIGTLMGIGAAICFVGVAATPWNIYMPAHMHFVSWAFRLFLGAVVLNLIAVLLEPALPKRIAWIFAIFGVLLFGYLFLIGHGFTGYRHLTIAATGQKIIAYAALATVQVQSHLMRRHIRTGDLEMSNDQAPNPNQFPMPQ